MRRSTFALLVALLVASRMMAAPQSTEPLIEVRALMDSGRTAEARTRLTELLNEYRRDAKPAREGICLLLLAVSDDTVSEPEAARRHFAEAVQVFAKQNDFFDAWIALAAAAELETRSGHYKAAIALHEQALAMLHDAERSDAPISVEGLKVFGQFLRMQFPPVPPELIKMMFPMFEPLSRDTYAGVLMEAGELEKADTQLQAAASSPFAGFYQQIIAIHVGDLRRRQWRLDDARASYLKALNDTNPFPLSFPTNQDNVAILGRLAEVEVRSGRTDEALQWNDQALQIVRRSSDSKREAAVLEDRGTLLMQAGRFQDAGAVFGQALKVARDGHHDSAEASVESSMGALHMFRGDYGSAAADFERSIALYQKLHDTYLEASIWTNLAVVKLLIDASSDRGEIFASMRELAKKSESPLAAMTVDLIQRMQDFVNGRASAKEMTAAFDGVFRSSAAAGLFNAHEEEVMQNLVTLSGGETPPAVGAATHDMLFFDSFSYMLQGQLLQQRGDLAGARALWMKALQTNPNHDSVAGYRALIGATYVREGRASEAIQWFTSAADALELPIHDLRVEEMLAGYLGTHRHFYFDVVIEMLLRQDRMAEAFGYAERARARAFLQLIGNTRLRPTAGGDPDLVRQAEAARTALPSLHGRDLELARRRYETLLERVKSTNPEYAAMMDVTPASLQTVQQELPADTTLISYFTSSVGAHVWIVDHARAEHVRLSTTPADINRIVCWAGEFGGVMDARATLPRDETCGGAATSQEVFDALMAPIAGKIHTRHLVIVPHGALHYVPFAALQDRRSGHYLIQDYTLTYAPSASALAILHARETPVQWKALVLGDPAAPTLPRLAGAEREAADVAALFGTTPKLGREATKGLLHALHGDVGLVHIAAHGFYDARNPLFSRIALAPDAAGNGDLEVHEILSDLDLSGVNLVVLSACSSGRGRRSGGDEVIGLTRSLLYAGAAGVISTLWDIHDQASAELMDAFYCRLLEGATAAEALRDAQLTLLRSERYSDPGYWAAFTLTGDPQGRWTR